MTGFLLFSKNGIHPLNAKCLSLSVIPHLAVLYFSIVFMFLSLRHDISAIKRWIKLDNFPLKTQVLKYSATTDK